MLQHREKITQNEGKFSVSRLSVGKSAMQLKDNRKNAVLQKNKTGLSDNLKSGIESLSGYSLDDVKVHYNSSQPAQLNAHAYAQGTNIHIAPGQERHLPHEAWHIVQQKQGRVRPTMQMKGKVNVNNDAGLEKEADVMGAKALQGKSKKNNITEKFYSKKQSAVTQCVDFGKHPANEKINPDVVGEENNGIRSIPPEGARPDDVPLIQPYRLAMHKLHNIILIFENQPGGAVLHSTAELREKMIEIQGKAKKLAKEFKTNMRDLSSGQPAEHYRTTYEKKMDSLTRELLIDVREGERIIRENGYVGKRNTIKKKGTNLWRTWWLKIKNAVNTAIQTGWAAWEPKLRSAAKRNKGENTSFRDWKQKVDGEHWDIFYGGSLMKGYKGPPKQNTRFLESNFDVDANMDAPAIAEYLINIKNLKVDRGQLDPSKTPETRVPQMDQALDAEVKKELQNANVGSIIPGGVDKIVSENFETRINAPATLGKKAVKEVTRSGNEQNVRDRLTDIRNTDPKKIRVIRKKLEKRGLYDAASHGLINGPLSPQQINKINQLLDTTL